MQWVFYSFQPGGKRDIQTDDPPRRLPPPGECAIEVDACSSLHNFTTRTPDAAAALARSGYPSVTRTPAALPACNTSSLKANQTTRAAPASRHGRHAKPSRSAPRTKPRKRRRRARHRRPACWLRAASSPQQQGAAGVGQPCAAGHQSRIGPSVAAGAYGAAVGAGDGWRRGKPHAAARGTRHSGGDALSASGLRPAEEQQQLPYAAGGLDLRAQAGAVESACAGARSIGVACCF